MSDIVNFQVRIKKGTYYVIESETGLIGIGDSFEVAEADLRCRKQERESLTKAVGIDLNVPDAVMHKNVGLSKYVKKWMVAFVFVSLMSIPLSYSISIGIKNGAKSIDFPRGKEVWQKLGDTIIDTSKSGSLNKQIRQQEIVDAIKLIRHKLKPYFEAMFGDEATDVQPGKAIK